MSLWTRWKKRREPHIKPLILKDVTAAEPQNPEKEDLISDLSLRFYRNVVEIGKDSAEIRHQLANGALDDLRGPRR